MSHDIKKLRPSKKARYKQGYINPKSCSKLYESQRDKPIIYRSSYERRFVQWLENSDKVIQWGSECVRIPYISAVDGQQHSYYPDYIVETKKGTFLIEVKPFNQTQPPDASLPHDSYAWRTYLINMSKWKAAQEFCAQHDLHFKIITEHTISKMG